jgi:hypothetical protein
MGKSSLIIVLGMAGIISFFILRMNSNSNENSGTTINMFELTQTRLIANSGVEIYLEKLYDDPTLINTTSAKQDLFNGSYIVKLEGTFPNVRVTSTATFNDVQHISVADAYLEPISFPNLPAGMYISTNSVTNAKLTGEMKVNGANHDVNGTIIGDGKTGAVYGIGVDSEEDKTSVLNGVHPKPENVKGLMKSTGEIGSPSVEVTNLGVDWSKLYQYLANAADQTFLNDIPMGANLGTLTQPLITLVNASASSTGKITIDKSSGAGILVVNGNVKFAGNFVYQGIILCYKNSDLTFESSGTNEIIGGLIAAGKLVDIKTAGTMDIKYSSAAIEAVKTNLKSNGFKILSWYE